VSDPFAVRDPGNPNKWPVGSRVVVPEAEDMHFFRPGTTGTVSRHKDYRYLGVIVRLDQPIRCSHGHFEHLIEEFNFNARDLEAAP
jgi:hypothetical protein